MKRTLAILLLITSSFVVGNIYAQDTGAWSSLDSNAIMIGDQLNYQMGIKVPVSSRVLWPQLGDTLTRNIEILGRSNIDTLITENDITLVQQFRITSFDSGYFEIPPMEFKFAFENDTNFYTTSTGILFLQVYVPEVDTSAAFKPVVGPIEEPYTLAEILPWIIVAIAAALIVGLIIFFIIKKRKKQPVFKRKAKPKLAEHIIAINQLEELRLAKIWQNGKLKKYYTDLVDITREYMVNRYHFDALEMTSHEIIAELNNHNINKEAREKLENVLLLSDMVKFAKAIPTPLENDLGLSHCVDFVNETKLVVEQPLGEDNNINKEKDSL